MLVFVTGARPNFIKVKALIDYCDKAGVDYTVFNSNQHSPNMQVFKMGASVLSSTSHNREGRFAFIMSSFSTFLNGTRPAVVAVVGDTDTSLACGLTADMRGIPVAHIEAGMRSYYYMPEETNRVALDRMSTYRLTSTTDAVVNLNREGMQGKLVGNLMIETLIRNWVPTKLDTPPYILMEFHRPENDSKQVELMEAAATMCLPVRFVVHPRHGNAEVLKADNITYLAPLSYQDMITEVANAALVCTDSGGLQADTSYLKVPCLTLRKGTEWLVTVTYGTNNLVGSVEKLMDTYQQHMGVKSNMDFGVSQLWDDQVSERIINILTEGVKDER